MLYFKIANILLICSLYITSVNSRKHKLKVVDDKRNQIHISKFGLLNNGYLFVNFTLFKLDERISIKDEKLNKQIGLTLVKTSSLGITPSMHNSESICPLNKEQNSKEKSRSVLFMYFDFENKRIEVDRGNKELSTSRIWNLSADNFTSLYLTDTDDGGFVLDRQWTNSPMVKQLTVNKTTDLNGVTALKPSPPTSLGLVDKYIAMSERLESVYSFYFLVSVMDKKQEGLYNLFYHNCLNYNETKYKKLKSNNFMVQIEERNPSSFLSAGEIPLPAIYFTFFVVYLCLAALWLSIIRRAGEEVFNIHYLMLTLVCVKFMALFFHSLNLHFIQNNGHHEEAFAILYYITYLIRGIVLFVTIVLIGAGWDFIKYILSDRDKKIFVIVIPLQILANVAQIFLEETEEGQLEHVFWRRTFYIVDLICCVTIIIPVIASIRHLTEASQTDGKAAISLSKLIIFRHFYMMIVCYIYFTRIIDFLMQVALPFQYFWVSVVFREIATIVFFTFTGYKFQPMTNNPYLQITQDDSDDDEINEIMSLSGVLDTVHKVNQVTYVGEDNGSVCCSDQPDTSSRVHLMANVEDNDNYYVDEVELYNSAAGSNTRNTRNTTKRRDMTESRV